MDHNMNLVQCSGKVLHKFYNEEMERLNLVLGIFIPKNHALNEDERINRDFPMITVEGEQAALINEEVEEGVFVSVVGHAESRPIMHYQGRSTYKKTYDTIVIADEVIPNIGQMNNNSVCLWGECTRIYRNPDKGKKFYILTIKTYLEDGTAVLTEAIFFDRRMELEPEVGDTVYVLGSLRTKNEVDPNSNKKRVLLSIVARSAVIR